MAQAIEMTTDTKQMRERLRDHKHMTQADGLAALLATGIEAADTIDALEARVAHLATWLVDMRNRAEATERQRDEAVEALQLARPIVDHAFCRAALDSDFEAACCETLNSIDSTISKIREKSE